MFETYKYMTSCISKSDAHKNLDELVKAYKGENDKRTRGKLFAAIFCKLFPLFFKLQKKFYSLSNEQKIEEAIYQLVKGLDSYDYKTKFITFITHHWTNKFKSFITNENCIKRKVNQQIIPHSELALQLYAERKTASTEIIDTQELIMQLKLANNLTSEEKEYCYCLLAGYKTLNEIASKMETIKHKTVVSNPLVMLDEQTRKTQEKTTAINIVRSIRKSLKKKAKQHGNNLFS